MRFPAVLEGIRARLVLIILLAMAALVGLLVYQTIEERSEQKERGVANLERMAAFAAQAQRERFEAVQRLLVLASQSETFRNVAANPADEEAHGACTRTLFVLDQILPGTRFSLWDKNGESLCSSRAATPGEFRAADHLWFRTVRDRGGFATGEFEWVEPDRLPTLAFGTPLKDLDGDTFAYLSTNLTFEHSPASFPAASGLPQGGRITIADVDGTVISSTLHPSGDPATWFPVLFSTLPGYLSSATVEGQGRVGTGVRITDEGDTLVGIVVSADESALATPLGTALVRGLTPVAIMMLVTLVAVWLLAHRWVVRPVAALVDASDALAEGRLEARANVPSGVAEFERLGHAFNEMAEARERASQAKDEFLGLVSHELKTPITTALGNAQILRSRGDAIDAESRAIALDDIHDSAMRLTAIIDNMLALARLERGVGLESEPLLLSRMVETETTRQLRRTPGRSIVRTGDRGIVALGGETHVEQVLRNLIANAVKYSPPDEPVEVAIESSGDMAVVRVRDRGEGIPEDERDQIFEPFYRSARTSGAAEGLGIGLSVCKRLIEAMGGEIWVHNRQGGGSEFGFSLPLVPEGLPPGPQTEPAPMVAAAEPSASTTA